MLAMISLCLSHQDASTDMQHDLFRLLRDLCSFFQKLFVKEYFDRSRYFDNI